MSSAYSKSQSTYSEQHKSWKEVNCSLRLKALCCRQSARHKYIRHHEQWQIVRGWHEQQQSTLSVHGSLDNSPLVDNMCVQLCNKGKAFFHFPYSPPHTNCTVCTRFVSSRWRFDGGQGFLIWNALSIQFCSPTIGWGQTNKNMENKIALEDNKDTFEETGRLEVRLWKQNVGLEGIHIKIAMYSAFQFTTPVWWG